ncbi:hypothetical protein STXM2123_6013 [Streptomyces sp. F-3]|uniref:Integral membrane protein n=1 Tax=Streptomyces thermogriseus TaxID=75292 RepID=A0ABN1T726_9ACTN|nr:MULTISPECIES: hypothetical protein [Streptomyces]MDN5385741.1 hypothetical protein [Streptomyces sp. LB8]GAT85312.1 hypothetical protein STXM2123_6013 [Streptomyces sp. F-3]
MEPVVRRPVAGVVAVVLLVEAFAVGALNWLLGEVVHRQQMSLAGLDPQMMSASAKAGGVLFGLCFALCGLVALRVAVRGRRPSRPGRVLLVGAAVVHGLLGAVAWGLVGWKAFVALMVVLALIVLLLMTYDPQEGSAGGVPGDAPRGDAGDGRKEDAPAGGIPPAPVAPPAESDAP